MTKCSECGKETNRPKTGISEPSQGSITGKDDATGKTKTLCWPCFNEKYELKKGESTNVFVKKGGSDH